MFNGSLPIYNILINHFYLTKDFLGRRCVCEQELMANILDFHFPFRPLFLFAGWSISFFFPCPFQFILQHSKMVAC